MKAVYLLTLCIVLAACSDEPDCLFSDQITLLDQAQFNGTTYSLVHRVSGFSDKVDYIELYKGEPLFDPCGEPSIEPISGDSYDQIDTNRVTVKNDKIIFINSDNTQPLAIKSIRFGRAE